MLQAAVSSIVLTPVACQGILDAGGRNVTISLKCVPLLRAVWWSTHGAPRPQIASRFQPPRGCGRADVVAPGMKQARERMVCSPMFGRSTGTGIRC